MSTLIEQGIIGIVIGILTTASLYLIKVIWTAKVVPFLSATRYSGVKIDGQWSGNDRNDNSENGDIYESESSLFLEQNAHSLSGAYMFKFKSENKEFSLNFDVNGYMWEGYITLNFTPKDKRITSYATTLLKLHDGGSSLIGTWLFRDVINESVNQVPLKLIRDANIASQT